MSHDPIIVLEQGLMCLLYYDCLPSSRIFNRLTATFWYPRDCLKCSSKNKTATSWVTLRNKEYRCYNVQANAFGNSRFLQARLSMTWRGTCDHNTCHFDQQLIFYTSWRFYKSWRLVFCIRHRPIEFEHRPDDNPPAAALSYSYRILAPSTTSDWHDDTTN